MKGVFMGTVYLKMKMRLMCKEEGRGRLSKGLRGFFLLGILLLLGCKEHPNNADEDLQAYLEPIQTAIKQLANTWYPRVLDTVNGGFWSKFDYDWRNLEVTDKMLVTQARHIWTAATLAQFYKDKNYEKIAAHGARFLQDKMWDSVHGGFYTLLALEDDGFTPRSKSKSAYGNSFAIYALATYHGVSGDLSALESAKETFLWLEEHAYDPEYQGYFDVLAQDGSWLLDVSQNKDSLSDYIRKDWKDQNSSIHLLESFTALYKVWPDPLLKKRLAELLAVIRDTITTEKGYLTLHLERDWTPISLRDSSATYREKNFWLDHVSFGHDVETAFLLLEASHALGLKDTLTFSRTKNMLDHALEWGWDTEKGGFFEGGYYWDNSGTRTIESDAKVWWVQAEGLNSLLLFYHLYPEEKHYGQRFQEQWKYIDTFMMDHEHGGWYHEGLDTHPEAKHDLKAYNWKVNYHNIRALVNVVQLLKGEFPLLENNKH